MRPWERKLALTIACAAVILAVGTCTMEKGHAVMLQADGPEFKRLFCPPDWHATISQRFDDRDRTGWIVKRTWISHCL